MKPSGLLTAAAFRNSVTTVLGDWRIDECRHPLDRDGAPCVSSLRRARAHDSARQHPSFGSGIIEDFLPAAARSSAIRVTGSISRR
jgi:hypothetical protein